MTDVSVALFLDNRGWRVQTLPPPTGGNASIGGSEYAMLALAEQLRQRLPLHLYLTAPLEASWLPPHTVVTGLAEAIAQAEATGCQAFIFRPGFEQPQDWVALEVTSLALIPWLHNHGCAEADRLNRLPALAAWVLPSGAHCDYLRHSRLHQRAVVIPHLVGIPASVEQDSQALHSPQDFAYVGALTAFKAFDRLARHWHAIAAACPGAKLQVFGGSDLYRGGEPGYELTDYERYCRRLLLDRPHSDRVIFHGSMGLERYERFQEVAVGFVNPSGRDETFCISALEFQACGVPVVAPRRHVMVETIAEGETGLLFASSRQLVRQAIALWHDSELRQRLGANGQRRYRTIYAPEPILDRWAQLLEDVVTGRPVTPPRPATPWHHEQRWLRQSWGTMQTWIPAWPDWPRCKVWLKRRLGR